jgi:hypothetical protein
MSESTPNPRAAAAGRAAPEPDGFAVLLDAYEPVLRAALADSAQTPADGELAGALAPSDEVALAARVAERFFSDENALATFRRTPPRFWGPTPSGAGACRTCAAAGSSGGWCAAAAATSTR